MARNYKWYMGISEWRINGPKLADGKEGYSVWFSPAVVRNFDKDGNFLSACVMEVSADAVEVTDEIVEAIELSIIDENDGTETNMHGLMDEWRRGNVPERSFPEYLANILGATLKGRNDCEFVGITNEEAKKLFRAIANGLY